jgi:hypothetical protein
MHTPGIGAAPAAQHVTAALHLARSSRLSRRGSIQHDLFLRT